MRGKNCWNSDGTFKFWNLNFRKFLGTILLVGSTNFYFNLEQKPKLEQEVKLFIVLELCYRLEMPKTFRVWVP